MSSNTALSKSVSTKPALLMAGKYLLLAAKASSNSKALSSLVNPGGQGSSLVSGRPESSAESRRSHDMTAGADLCLSRLEEGGTMSVETSFQLLKLYLVPAGRVFMSGVQ